MTDANARRETLRAECRAFVAAEIAPHAARFDREELFPKALIPKLA